MNEEKILQQDLSKIHAEVNQIVSQRFQLTTLAIIVFAVVCGWATASIGRPGGINVEFVTLVTVLMILVLFTLFIYFMFLLGMMRIFTVYLEEKHGSHWEIDWHEYRRQKDSRVYWGYSKAGTTVFVVLGPLSFGFLVALSWLSGGLSWAPILWLPVVVLLVYEVVVLISVSLRQKLIDEGDIRNNWGQAITAGDTKRRPLSRSIPRDAV